MAAGSVTRNISTTFSLNGLREAAAGLRGLAQRARQSFSDMRQAAKEKLAAVGEQLKKITSWSFDKLRKGAVLAFKGIAIGAAAAAIKIKSIAIAAYESSKGIAEMLNQVSKDSRRLGVKAEDLGVLSTAE